MNDIENAVIDKNSLEKYKDDLAKIREIEKEFQNSIEELNSLSRTFLFLEDIRDKTHIRDIDVEWEYSHTLGKEVERLSEGSTSIESDIDGLRDKVTNLDKLLKFI